MSEVPVMRSLWGIGPPPASLCEALFSLLGGYYSPLGMRAVLLFCLFSAFNLVVVVVA